MTKGRLEAFTDAVIAIIMTIMVLELKAPEGVHIAEVKEMTATILSYILSFVMLGIYWNNHHHMLQSAKRVSGGVLWANQHLLFWLSLVPFGTAWMGRTNFASAPVAAFGAILLMAAIAYYILAQVLARVEGTESAVALALGKDFKGKVSIVVYAIGVAAAFAMPLVSCALYVAVALMWLVPDRRFETNHHNHRAD